MNWTSLRSLAMVLLLVWGGSQALSWWQDRRFAETVRLGSQRHELVVYSTDIEPEVLGLAIGAAAGEGLKNLETKFGKG